nr:MAG: hypothetical protein [Bacteriophage sp.]
MSIQGEIDRLSAAKASIAASLQSMGVDPPDGTTLEQYAAQLAAIAVSAPWLPLSGGTMTGNLDLGGKSILNAAGISVASFTLNASIGGSGSAQISTNGSQVSFESGFGSSMRLSGISSPSSSDDAATKGYVDSKGPKTATVTLTTDGWRKGEQTVTVNGILADSSAQIVDVCPANKPSADRWAAAGVWCTSQAANSLIFSYDSVPTEDINVNIRMQGVSA